MIDPLVMVCPPAAGLRVPSYCRSTVVHGNFSAFAHSVDSPARALSGSRSLPDGSPSRPKKQNKCSSQLSILFLNTKSNPPLTPRVDARRSPSSFVVESSLLTARFPLRAGPAVITRRYLPAFSQPSFAIFDLKN